MEWYVIVGLGVAIVTAVVAWNQLNGNSQFWKAVAAKPQSALRLFRLNKQHWQVFEVEPPEGYKHFAPSKDWVGPFRIYDPLDGRFVVIFGRAEGLVEAQKSLLDTLGHMTD